MKIFGIGLSKTGTTSLHKALTILGYKAIHYPGSIAGIEAHDAITDVQGALAFKLWDVMYPGSRFIYTTRDKVPWLESCRSHFQRHSSNQFALSLRKAVYGMTGFDAGQFSRVYDEHDASVRDYFQERDDLLEMDICGGYGWDKLCSFLGKPVPRVPFPHENATHCDG